MRTAIGVASWTILFFVFLGELPQGIGQAVKNLDETSGLKLLRDTAKQSSYKIPAGNLLKLLNHSQKDYSQANGLSGAEVAVHNLLKENLVVQTTDVVRFPRISGQYVRRLLKTDDSARFTLDHIDHWRVEKLDLNMVEGTNNVNGTWTSVLDPPYERGNGFSHHRFVGQITADGHLRLTDPDPSSLAHYNLLYQESGGDVSLVEGEVKYTGHANGRVETKWYTYSPSPELQRQIIMTPRGPVLPVGQFEIGELADLRLETETVAEAQFKWLLILNQLGKAIVSGPPPIGIGTAIF